MRRKRLSLTEVLDVYGLRVVVATHDECYRVLGVVHELFKPVTGRFKDYIAIPKAYGSAIPRQSGRATKKTDNPAGRSCLDHISR